MLLFDRLSRRSFLTFLKLLNSFGYWGTSLSIKLEKLSEQLSVIRSHLCDIQPILKSFPFSFLMERSPDYLATSFDTIETKLLLRYNKLWSSIWCRFESGERKECVDLPHLCLPQALLSGHRELPSSREAILSETGVFASSPHESSAVPCAPTHQ